MTYSPKEEWSKMIQDIVGVQPMPASAGKIFNVKYSKRFVKIDNGEKSIIKAPAGHVLVDVDWAVALWIEEQPIHMWKPMDDRSSTYYIISEELYTWMAVRWS